MRLISNSVILFVATLLTGCAVTSHPDYEKTYFKSNISDAQVQEVIRQFKNAGFVKADVTKDSLGRLILSGEYKNEREVDQALAILEKIVGVGNYVTVRPQSIRVLRWEIEASQEFEKYIKTLSARYKLSVSVESDGADKQINVTNLGLDGVEQFAFGSDEPTAKTQEFYKQLATQWKASTRHLASSKKILIVGHTDDVGESRYNMELSERRARAIGRIFASAGFPPANLHYQGAGEVLPIASNESADGRAKNRRVEIAELSDTEAMRLYITSRRTPVAFYRYESNKQLQTATTPVTSGASKAPATSSPAKTDPKDVSRRNPETFSSAPTAVEGASPRAYSQLDLGGVPYTPQNATLKLAKYESRKSTFSFISHAQAEDVSALSDCTKDRARSLGAVKTLDTGLPQNYRPTDYMKGISGKSWYGAIKNNLVVLDNVYVLRDNGESPVPTKLKAYEKYSNNPSQKPTLEAVSPVNSYLLGNGVLYRVFPPEATGLKCMDILLPVDGQGRVDQGLIVYSQRSGTYVAEFKPQASY